MWLQREEQESLLAQAEAQLLESMNDKEKHVAQVRKIASPFPYTFSGNLGCLRSYLDETSGNPGCSRTCLDETLTYLLLRAAAHGGACDAS